MQQPEAARGVPPGGAGICCGIVDEALSWLGQVRIACMCGYGATLGGHGMLCGESAGRGKRRTGSHGSAKTGRNGGRKCLNARLNMCGLGGTCICSDSHPGRAGGAPDTRNRLPSCPGRRRRVLLGKGVQGRTGPPTGVVKTPEGRCPIPRAPFPAASRRGRGPFFEGVSAGGEAARGHPPYLDSPPAAAGAGSGVGYSNWRCSEAARAEASVRP